MATLDLLTLSELKKSLTAFNPSVSQQKPSAALQTYLNFYNLPTLSDQLSLAVGTIVVNQSPIFAAAWQPPKSVGTALVVHGYMDHLGLYNHLIDFLISRNLTVVCFDLPGHGLSAGEAAFIEDFADYSCVLESLIGVCQQYFPAPLHALGQSMGGAILLKHLIDSQSATDCPFKTINLLAPLLRPKAWSINQWLLTFIRPFRKSVKRAFSRNSYDQNFLNFLRYKDPLQARAIPLPWLDAAGKWVREFEISKGSDFPINLIQGNADKTLNWQYNIEVFKHKLPNINLHMVGRANHHLVNEIQPLRAKILEAIEL